MAENYAFDICVVAVCCLFTMLTCDFCSLYTLTSHSRVDVISKGHGTSCVYIIYVYVLALTAILLSFKIRRKTDDKNINNKTMFMCARARANINNVKIHVQCARWGIGNAKTQAQLLPFAFF